MTWLSLWHIKRLLEEEWRGAVNFHADNMSKEDRHKGIKNAQIQLLHNPWDRDIKWTEHSRHYAGDVHRRYIQITSSRWRLERYTFHKNKHTLFSVADSQRQAYIKRQSRSKTCSATMSHPVDKYGKPWDSTACGSACYLQLKAMKSCFNLPEVGRAEGRTYREGRHVTRCGVSAPASMLVLCLNMKSWGNSSTSATLMGPKVRHAE